MCTKGRISILTPLSLGFFASWMYICMGSVLGSSVQGHSSWCTHLCDNICWIPRCRPCHTNLCVCVCAHSKVREPERVWVCVSTYVCVCVMYSQDIFPEVLSVMRLQILTGSTLPSWPAASVWEWSHTQKTNTDTHTHRKRVLCHQ